MVKVLCSEDYFERQRGNTTKKLLLLGGGKPAILARASLKSN